MDISTFRMYKFWYLISSKPSQQIEWSRYAGDCIIYHCHATYIIERIMMYILY